MSNLLKILSLRKKILCKKQQDIDRNERAKRHLVKALIYRDFLAFSLKKSVDFP